MFNFLRFGEKNNSIVFDLSDEQKQQLVSGQTTMDDIYEDFRKDPVGHIKRVKSVGIEGLLGIVGRIDGNSDSSNGAGKSTVMEAICYAHYGRIVRLSANTDSTGDAGNLIVTQINGQIPETVSESWVEEFFESNGKIYRIKRGRAFSKTRKTSSPILEFETLTKDDVISESGHRTTDTKRSVDEVNDMPYELFVNSQMFGQNDAGKFLFGTDRIRKEMLISLLDMESAVSQCLKMVREKRSKSDKKIEVLSGTLKVLESQLVAIYKKYIQDDNNVYSDAVSNNFVLVVNQAVEDNQIEIYNCDKEIKSISDKVTELLNSDVMVRVSSIRSEGLKTKQEKESKIKQRDEQTSQWSKLLKETTDEETKKSNEQISLAEKIKKINGQIEEIKKFINAFDKKKCDEDITRAIKAKEVKPKYESKKQELSDKALEIAGNISEIKTKLTISQNTVSKLSCQMAKIKEDGKIECLECKSLVGKIHFESKISEENDKQKVLNTQSETLNASKTSINTQLNEVNSRLSKIADFLQAETLAVAAMATFDMKNQTMISLKERLTDLDKAIASVINEISTLSNKKAEYKARISQIESSFKAEIEELDKKLDDLRKKLMEAQGGADAINKQIEALNNNKKGLEGKKAKLNEKIGSDKKELEQFKNISSQFKSASIEMNEEVKVLTRYGKLEDVFGLDGIQTRIVKRYLPLLNIYVKEFLDILSEGTLNIRMIINDKSEVDMSISGGTAPTYKMLSGGEKMIIRLSVDIGLALLKFARSAKKPEIICLDEIFGPLDASRTSAVFRMLHALQDKFNRVLIITHNSEIKDMIPNNIMIEKTGGLYGLSEIKYIS